MWWVRFHRFHQVPFSRIAVHTCKPNIAWEPRLCKCKCTCKMKNRRQHSCSIVRLQIFLVSFWDVICNIDLRLQYGSSLASGYVEDYKANKVQDFWDKTFNNIDYMLKETIKCSITIQIQLIFRNHFKVLVLGVKKTSQHKNASVVGLQHHARSEDFFSTETNW